MNRWLVVMAKQPRAGRVKSRLARDVGAVEATRFYRVTLQRLIRRLGRDRRWTTVLAVSPDSAAGDPVWPRGVPVIGQGGGDLGVRMQGVMDRLPPGPAIIVGSDIPGIEPAHVADAFHSLGRHDVVFGPATDGGYWLAGMRRRPRVPRLFDAVRWSTRHALKDTLRNCGGLSVGFAATLSDVDDVGDWRKWRRGDPL
ncbi:TIGR04282 family arsenosugar biosynthesis glycosyltransferase [Microbaculum sp. FT89]|uniref:TIGR04282 family arsenosugar biosynthesis glycosyltransferase n=1 Tax=Microbaculum sp. FT89 TaxID=3447298 RepID=UPI003F53B70D